MSAGGSVSRYADLGVSMHPGSMALTRMPCPPSTAPSALTSMLTPPLVPQYATCVGDPTWAERELAQQIAPLCPSLTICFAPSVQTSHVPRKFVSDRASKSSIDVSSHLSIGLMPALDTT